MVLLAVAALLLLWTCGSVVVLAICWAAGHGDEQEVVLPAAPTAEVLAFPADRALVPA